MKMKIADRRKVIKQMIKDMEENFDFHPNKSEIFKEVKPAFEFEDYKCYELITKYGLMTIKICLDIKSSCFTVFARFDSSADAQGAFTKIGYHNKTNNKFNCHFNDYPDYLYYLEQFHSWV